MAEKF